MTATTGTNEQIAAAIVNRAVTLEPPQTLETGALVLLRMAAHSRSPEQREYFAPAVVLAQYEPNGEIDALVWDASAGNAFVHGYAIRDLGTRDTQHGREQYVIQSNIGQVLFSPAAMLKLEDDATRALSEIIGMRNYLKELAPSLRNFDTVFAEYRVRLEALEQIVTQPAGATAPAPVPQPAASMEAKQQPKADAKRA